MDKVNSGILSRIFKKKITKIIIVLLVIFLGSYLLIHNNVFGLQTRLFGAKAASAAQLRTERVTKGDLNVTVTGSGPISSSSRVDVFPSVETTITKVYFKEGDKVKEGDLMYELDDTDARSNIETIKNDIARKQISQNTTVSDIGKLKVIAPASGYIADLTAVEGDTVGKGSVVMNLVDTSKFKITVPFYSFVSIKVGQEANVTFPGSFSSIKGTVTNVGDKTSSTADGSSQRNVEVTVDNPGSTLEGQTARVEINSQQNAEDGTFVSAGSTAVKSESGGTIEKLYVKNEQYVTKGTVLMVLGNDDLLTSKENNDLDMAELQTRLKTAEEQLADYKIYAPITGTIIKQDTSVGDAAKRGTLLSTISDPEHMDFDIPIDELDIAKIEVGQKVNITVDALPETETKPLTGQVSDIAVEGSSSNGVTTYPVTIGINETSKLKAGMNANAEIMISQKSDVLLVPLEAIRKVNGKTFVTVIGGSQNGAGMASGNRSMRNGGQNQTGSAGGSSNGAVNGNTNNNGNMNNGAANTNGSNSARNRNTGGNASGYADMSNAQGGGNTTLKPVEIGINNDEFAEVISGLQEGDVVVLPSLSTGTGQNNAQIRTGMGGFGGMAPAGGAVRINSGGGNNRNGG